MSHTPRKGDDRYRCRYCNKSFVVATMTTHHEDNYQCPENPTPAEQHAAAEARSLAHHGVGYTREDCPYEHAHGWCNKCGTYGVSDG